MLSFIRKQLIFN